MLRVCVYVWAVKHWMELLVWVCGYFVYGVLERLVSLKRQVYQSCSGSRVVHVLCSMDEDTEKPRATRQNEKAIALKKRSAVLANEQPIGDKPVDYGHIKQLAEWPVFFAYARLVGPVCVFSVPAASVATMYSFDGARDESESPPEPCIYLFHNNKHFQRLAPARAGSETEAMEALLGRFLSSSSSSA
jgi:hypothetical protein